MTVVFDERGKLEHRKKKPLEKSRTNKLKLPTHEAESMEHIGGMRVLSPLRQPSPLDISIVKLVVFTILYYYVYHTYLNILFTIHHNYNVLIHPSLSEVVFFNRLCTIIYIEGRVNSLCYCDQKITSINFVPLAPVVQKVEYAIHWINYYPLDSALGFASVLLSSGYKCYPSFMRKIAVKIDRCRFEIKA